MSPTGYLDDVAGLVQVVIDGVRVGDEIAFVAAEESVDRFAVVFRRVGIKHVPLGRDEHEEVSVAAFLFVPSWPRRRVLDLAPARWQTTLQEPETQRLLGDNVFRRATLVAAPS
jgi:hypothetical protein